MQQIVEFNQLCFLQGYAGGNEGQCVSDGCNDYSCNLRCLLGAGVVTVSPSPDW